MICERCNMNKAKNCPFCAICWSIMAHAQAEASRGNITLTQLDDVLSARATIDFPGFPYADPAVNTWDIEDWSGSVFYPAA